MIELWISLFVSLGFVVVIFYQLYKLVNRKPKTVTICPRCGSLDKQIVGTMAGLATTLGGQNIPRAYKCMQCNHKGIFPTIDSDKVVLYQEELQNNK